MPCRLIKRKRERLTAGLFHLSGDMGASMSTESTMYTIEAATICVKTGQLETTTHWHGIDDC